MLRIWWCLSYKLKCYKAARHDGVVRADVMVSLEVILARPQVPGDLCGPCDLSDSGLALSSSGKYFRLFLQIESSVSLAYFFFFQRYELATRTVRGYLFRSHLIPEIQLLTLSDLP